MASTFKSSFVSSVGLSPAIVYGPAPAATQVVIFGLSATNLQQFPVNVTFYINNSRPTATAITVTTITNATSMIVSSAAGLAIGNRISSSNFPSNIATISNIVGNTLTVDSTLSWGSPGIITASAVYIWSAAVNVNLLYLATVPVGSALVALGNDQKLVLLPTDSLYVQASSASAVDVTCSYLEIA